MILIIYFYILKIFLYINIKDNFLKIKNIILIHFQIKNTLKKITYATYKTFIKYQ
jgi:hypothetical protein